MSVSKCVCVCDFGFLAKCLVFFSVGKMRQSYSEVWRVLLAFDVTCSGVLPLEDLHSIINNFLFPMSLCTFHSLLRRYQSSLLYCTSSVMHSIFNVCRDTEFDTEHCLLLYLCVCVCVDG